MPVLNLYSATVACPRKGYARDPQTIWHRRLLRVGAVGIGQHVPEAPGRVTSVYHFLMIGAADGADFGRPHSTTLPVR